MDKLISTLPAILKASGAGAEIVEAACMAAWKHAVGEGLSSQAIPLRLQDGTLTLAVADNIWKRQLEHMRGQLLFRLNQVLGQPLVESIEIEIDPRRIEQQPATQANVNDQVTNRQIPAELLASAADIEDAHLRRAFLGAATSCVNRIENPKSEISNRKA
ncbi:MAG TPA: DUF721 domain-containing protein [Pyrinomonadaceae bacterium]|nr:DUF721 domain-containing protein [Pyrinomonadaceae bacterium]